MGLVITKKRRFMCKMRSKMKLLINLIAIILKSLRNTYQTHWLRCSAIAR